jgi:hypothetical protein
MKNTKQIENSSWETSWGNRNHPNIFKQFRREENREKIIKLTESLGNCVSLLGNRRSAVLYGYGEQMKSTYRNLKYEEGISVLCHDSCLPGILKPLGYIFPSEMGLIQILDTQKLPAIFDVLSELAVVELFSFDENLITSVEQYSKRNGRNGQAYDIILEDKSFFCFGIMGDSESSSTGYVFWVSYGEECPSDLKYFVKEIFE